MKIMKRGFTLIELLVVIAIIGILASIVLVSFPGATARARDTRIISAIGQARTVMAFFKANDGTYVNFSAAAQDMPALVEEVKDNCQGCSVEDLVIVKKTDNTAVCMYSELNETDKYYCADSTGTALKYDAIPTDKCNTTTATCD